MDESSNAPLKEDAKEDDRIVEENSSKTGSDQICKEWASWYKDRLMKENVDTAKQNYKLITMRKMYDWNYD